MGSKNTASSKPWGCLQGPRNTLETSVLSQKKRHYLLHSLAQGGDGSAPQRPRTAAAPTVLHVFGDDVDGLLGDHRVEPDQPLVLQLLHEVGLGQEGVGGHAALL